MCDGYVPQIDVTELGQLFDDVGQRADPVEPIARRRELLQPGKTGERRCIDQEVSIERENAAVGHERAEVGRQLVEST